MKKFLKYYLVATVIVTSIVIYAVYASFAYTAAPVKVGTEFLVTLKTGDISVAYEMTSERFRDNVTPRMLEFYLESHPIITNYTEFSFYTKQVEDGFAKLGGTIISEHGTEDDGVGYVNVQLIFEDDEWKILSFDDRDPLVVDERTVDDIDFEHFY